MSESQNPYEVSHVDIAQRQQRKPHSRRRSLRFMRATIINVTSLFAGFFAFAFLDVTGLGKALGIRFEQLPFVLLPVIFLSRWILGRLWPRDMRMMGQRSP